MTTVDRWIHHWGEQRPLHPAIVFGAERVSYRDLSDRIHAAVSVLLGLGVDRGDRVGFCGRNNVEQLSLLFGCARLGAVYVPFNNRLSAAEHEFQITDSDPVIIFGSDGFAPQLTPVASGRTVVDLDAEPLAGAADPVASRGSSDDAVLMVYTSGTTGRPKGAVHTQDSLFHAVLNGVAHQDLDAGDRILTSLPLFHVGGLNVQTLPALYVGATVYLQHAFDPGEALRIVREERPTQTLQVPATMRALLAHPDLERTDLSCLDGMNSGSSIVPPQMIRRFGELGVRVGQVYGATETGPTSVVLRYDDADRVGSCGKAAMHTELRVVDGRLDDVEPGQPGEVLLRGRNIFTGYWGQPEQTATAFVDGWYRTGDVGRVDGDGFLFIEDRVKDMLISGGENVYPAEVENALIEHPAIAEVAVLARPDERWGEVPVAVVVVADGVSAPTASELRSWCDGRLARYKQPDDVITIDSLPRTALGKVTKHELYSRLGDI